MTFTFSVLRFSWDTLSDFTIYILLDELMKKEEI